MKSKPTPNRRKARQPAQRHRKLPDRLVGLREVTLRAAHNVNGVGYGPGKCTVPADLVDVLMEQESRIQAESDHFLGRRAVLVGPRPAGASSHSLLDVAYEDFDSSFNRVQPIIHIAGE